MTQLALTQDDMIDPRLNRYDNPQRVAKRSRPYENETTVFNRRLRRGPSIRTCPNTLYGLDLNDPLKRRPENIALPGLNLSIKEGYKEDLDSDKEFNSDDEFDGHNCFDNDSNDSEDELPLVGDEVGLADETEISILEHLGGQGSISEAFQTLICQGFRISSSMTFSPEMSREATTALVSQSAETVIPCKSLKLFAVLHAKHPLMPFTNFLLLAAAQESISRCNEWLSKIVHNLLDPARSLSCYDEAAAHGFGCSQWHWYLANSGLEQRELLVDWVTSPRVTSTRAKYLIGQKY
jgi:hypothetical protein